MALNNDIGNLDRDVAGFDPEIYANDTGRSNFTSFLIGGVVVASGMMAFLFYDGGTIGQARDTTTMPSLLSVQTPAMNLSPPSGESR